MGPERFGFKCTVLCALPPGSQRSFGRNQEKNRIVISITKLRLSLRLEYGP